VCMCVYVCVCAYMCMYVAQPPRRETQRYLNLQRACVWVVPAKGRGGWGGNTACEKKEAAFS